MELDAIVVREARLNCLNEMSDQLRFACSLPTVGMKEVNYDVVLAQGTGIIITCMVPQGMTKRGFVEEVCQRATDRCVSADHRVFVTAHGR